MRTERELQLGDRVYLKLQPYRQVTVSNLRTTKLSPKYYGSYQIKRKIGDVAYELELPP